MLTISEVTRDRRGLSRRALLRAGGLGAAGLTLSALLRGRGGAAAGAAAAPHLGRAHSVIYLFLSGGPSQYETFDPKPDAPAEVRGTFRPVATGVPGVRFCELLPNLARLADRLAVVRALATDDPNHESAGYWVNTGRRYDGPDMRALSPSDWPTLGAVVKRLRPSETSPLTSVMLPEPIVANPNVFLPGQTAGFLGSRWDPEILRCDPAAPDFRVDLFAPAEGLTPSRLGARGRLLERLDGVRRLADRDPAVRLYDHHASEALGVLLSGAVRDAFRLDREPPQLRDRYGRGRWGQSVLLARRLVEAGVRMVFVNWPREPGDLSADNPLWDTHSRNDARMRDVLCPQLDAGLSALVEDLDQRGLLGETLVVAVGEMGRTPRFNAGGGRDHWGHVFSFVAAGAGVCGGCVHGESDRDGAYPLVGRVEPQDLTATILHLLGVGPDASFPDRLGRPLRATEGQPIRPILA